jgi:hypothetical protein
LIVAFDQQKRFWQPSSNGCGFVSMVAPRLIYESVE